MNMLHLNEWDPLKRVIVGRPDGGCQPKSDLGWDYYCPRAGFEFGPMPDEMIEKAKDQMLLTLIPFA